MSLTGLVPRGAAALGASYALCLLLAVGAPPALAKAPAAATPVEFWSRPATGANDPPFSDGVRVGELVFLSGQIGVAPGTRQLVAGGFAEQARQVMDNIRATLAAHGLTTANLVKCTVMLADMADWPAFNEIYRSYFPAGRYPARSAFGASGLALGARLEVECIAATRL